jgi:hypothetical protein
MELEDVSAGLWRICRRSGALDRGVLGCVANSIVSLITMYRYVLCVAKYNR